LKDPAKQKLAVETMANIMQATYDSVPDEDVNNLPFEFLDSYGIQKDGSMNLPPVPSTHNFKEFEKYEGQEITMGEKVRLLSHTLPFFLQFAMPIVFVVFFSSSSPVL
jgi:hypothetical protein